MHERLLYDALTPPFSEEQLQRMRNAVVAAFGLKIGGIGSELLGVINRMDHVQRIVAGEFDSEPPRAGEGDGG